MRRPLEFVDAEGSRLKFAVVGTCLVETCDGEVVAARLRSLTVATAAVTTGDERSSISIHDGDCAIPVPARDRGRVLAWLRASGAGGVWLTAPPGQWLPTVV